MTARAIWKGELRLAEIGVPVKLYSALEDRSVHFRLLHETDHQPVRQAMVNPETDEIVPQQETQRAYYADEGEAIVISRDELEQLKPEKSREIEVLTFLPPAAIDHRWYDRAYYLGPDGGKPRTLPWRLPCRPKNGRGWCVG